MQQIVVGRAESVLVNDVIFKGKYSKSKMLNCSLYL